MQSFPFLTALDPSSNADILSQTLTTVPSHTQVPYTVPPLPVLLSLSAYLYLISATSTLADYVAHAPLIGPLITGVLLGPTLAGLLSPSTQQTFISLGYIGLILIVFEAGLTTHIPLLIGNIGVSTAAAVTGVVLPIALSLALLHGAYGYTKLQSFAAGAALCSTSLGTTLALLTPRLRKTRVGSVLMCAALLDDVVGLVIAGIIANLANSEEGGVKWETIVRPVLVSIAFGLGSPALAWMVRWLIRTKWRRFEVLRYLGCKRTKRSEVFVQKTQASLIYSARIQLFFIVCTLSAFVAGSSYAGTSELFGAYLAGAFLAYIFGDSRPAVSPLNVEDQLHQRQPSEASKKGAFSNPSFNSTAYIEPVGSQGSHPGSPLTIPSTPEEHNPTLNSFNTHIAPILTPLLGPIFFASVGSALPVGSLFTTSTTLLMPGNGSGETMTIKSHSVIWKGIVYALLMAFSKAAVGVWMVVWRYRGSKGDLGTGSVSSSERAWIFLRHWRKLKDLNLWRGWKRKIASSPKQTQKESGNGGEGDALKSVGRITSVKHVDDVEHGTSNLTIANIIDASTPSSSSSQNISPSHPESDVQNVQRSPPSSNDLSNKAIPKSTGMVIVDKDESEPPPVRAALLLGLAMIARGEIALIVAQLARPLLVHGRDGITETGGEEEEPYAVVIWAIVLCTLGGAVGVGWLLGRWERDEKRMNVDKG